MAKLVIGTSNQAVVPSIVKRVEVPMPTGKYSLLDRVVDDSNNSIGTVVGFHIDANNVEYAVVCLDAVYRLAQGQYLSNKLASLTTVIPGLIKYPWNQFENSPVFGKETATSNCDAILAYANANNYTSSAVSHCRAQTFTIEGVTYSGQLPTVCEFFEILPNMKLVDSLDPTVSDYQSVKILQTKYWWTSTTAGYNASYRENDSYVFQPQVVQFRADYDLTMTQGVLPILEIPNAL